MHIFRWSTLIYIEVEDNEPHTLAHDMILLLDTYRSRFTIT